MKLNIISYQGKAIPNHNEIPLHLHQDGYNQRTDNKSTGKDVEKLEPSYTASVILKWCGHTGKQSGSSSKVKQRIVLPEISFLAICPREMKAYVHTQAYP